MEPIVGIPVLSDLASTDNPILERKRKLAKFLRGITKKCLDFTEMFSYSAPIRRGLKGAAVNNLSAKRELTTTSFRERLKGGFAVAEDQSDKGGAREHHIRAVVLTQLEYWQSRVNDFDRFIREKCERERASGEEICDYLVGNCP